MNWKSLKVSVIGLISSLMLPAGSSASTPPKPKIVFILADDLGYADLACYGANGIKTANPDNIAGINFYTFIRQLITKL